MFDNSEDVGGNDSQGVESTMLVMGTMMMTALSTFVAITMIIFAMFFVIRR